MRIEYADGTIHNVTCYRFCQANIQGENIYFIEYKDLNNQRPGNNPDSYAIIVKNNGVWQKVDRNIDYNLLSTHVVQEFNPFELGDNISFYRVNNLQNSGNRVNAPANMSGPNPMMAKMPMAGNNPMMPRPELKNNEQKPKQESQSKMPVMGNNPMVSGFGLGNSEPEPKPETQVEKQKIKPMERKKIIVYIPVLTDEDKQSVSAEQMKMLKEMGFMRGLLFNGILNNASLSYSFASKYNQEYSSIENKLNLSNIRDGQNVQGLDLASFNIVPLPKMVLDILGKVGTPEKIRKAIVESDNIIYRFFPASHFLQLALSMRLDVVLNKQNKVLLPEQILEGFFDYSIPKGKLALDDREVWVGYTKDVEIKELRSKVEELFKENISLHSRTQEMERDIYRVKNALRVVQNNISRHNVDDSSSVIHK